MPHARPPSFLPLFHLVPCFRFPPLPSPLRAVSVESTGALPARDLVLLALDILREKTVKVAAAFDAALASESHGVMDAASATRATIAAMRTDVDDLSSRY